MQIEGPPVRDIGAVGDTLQLRAIATLDDGTRPDVTAESTWTVTNPNVLSVSNRGLVTAVGNGGAFVSAIYRERAGTTNLTVRPEAGARYPLTGVVIDRDTRLPIAGAFVSATPGAADRQAFTDGNGFFDLGAAIRPVTLTATGFGFADAVEVVSGPRGPAHVSVGLLSNGPSVERTVDLDAVPTGESPPFDPFGATHRIATRPGGVFDAVATGPCDYSDSVGLTAENGGVRIPSTGSNCTPRVRFVAATSEVRLIVRVRARGTIRLTWREPR
jgi:hypothetical protein